DSHRDVAPGVRRPRPARRSRRRLPLAARQLMAVEFRITKGARAGARDRFDKSIVAIGRHPINDLRFDAERDLDVSSRHAELRIVGERYVLVDLGSTNGTFVNGEAVDGERALRDGDVITFGSDGPQCEFRIVGEQASASPSRGLPASAAAT